MGADHSRFRQGFASFYHPGRRFQFREKGEAEAFALLNQAAAIPGWEGKSALHLGRLHWRKRDYAAAAALWRSIKPEQLRDPADRKALADCLSHLTAKSTR